MRAHHTLYVTLIACTQGKIARLRGKMRFLNWKTITFLVIYQQIGFPQY